tara:strand:+ start:3200 stop:3826 length:627 start_codon:yes stop_codon:yes gene_type:complete
MDILKKFFISNILLLFITLPVNAQEFNNLETYSGSINGAYGVTNLPLLPGKWKVDDLEKSGSISSGNFYVYATMIPAEADEISRRYNDIIFYAILGSKSEETEYRKTFFGCEGGGYETFEDAVINIDTRGSGNFEEYCMVDQSDFGNINFFYTDCSDICVEVGMNLDRESYKNDLSSIKQMAKLLVENTRKTLNSENGSFDFINDYKN